MTSLIDWKAIAESREAELSEAQAEIARLKGDGWEGVAVEVTQAVAMALEPLAREAADDLYERLLSTMQDNLADNARFNISSRLDTAERERRSSWERVEAAESALLSLRSAAEEALGALGEAREVFNQVALSRRITGPIATKAQHAAHFASTAHAKLAAELEKVS